MIPLKKIPIRLLKVKILKLYKLTWTKPLPLYSAQLFKGSTNSIIMNREYYQDYACGFDLTYYPFDTQVNSCIVFTFDSIINSFILQVCTVVVEVQGKTDNFVRLVKDFDGIDFIGNNLI